MHCGSISGSQGLSAAKSERSFFSIDGDKLIATGALISVVFMGFMILVFGLSWTVNRCVPAVDDKPDVSFSVDRPSVSRGQAAVLSWNIKRGSMLTIEGTDGFKHEDTAMKGSVIVRPQQTVSYTIFASGKVGITQKALDVTVR